MKHQNGYADLHLHTHHSDGQCSPQEVVDKCSAYGLRAIAIVDHDEISGLPEAIEYGRAKGLEVLTGVELSVSFQNLDIHVLGYGFDCTHGPLVDYIAFLKEERVKRARRIVQRLAQMGMPLTFEAVLEKAGMGSVGRPHIAHALVEAGYVNSFQEAFNRFLADGRPANIRKHKIDITAAMKLIAEAGGVCALAHPGLQLRDEQVLQLAKVGLDAIEVVHPKHTPERVRFYRDLAESNGLLATGGSDFHGGARGEESLGKYTIPYEIVVQIKRLTAN